MNCHLDHIIITINFLVLLDLSDSNNASFQPFILSKSVSRLPNSSRENCWPWQWIFYIFINSSFNYTLNATQLFFICVFICLQQSFHFVLLYNVLFSHHKFLPYPSHPTKMQLVSYTSVPQSSYFLHPSWAPSTGLRRQDELGFIWVLSHLSWLPSRQTCP